MNRAFVRIFLPCFLILSALISHSADSDREKIAEGEFQTVPGAPMTDPTQSWVLWRDANGKLQLEDHFTHFDDPALMMLAPLAAHLDPGLKKQVADKVGQTGIEVILTTDWKTERFIVHGIRVADSKAIELANCEVKDREVACKGFKRSTKLKRDSGREFFYLSHFPLLLRSFALRAKNAPNGTATIPLIQMALTKEGVPELLEADAKVVYQGDEVLTIGDNRFNGRKFSVETRSTTGTFESTVWLSGNDVVLAAQNQDRTLMRVLMSRFKKYSDF